MRDPAAMRAAEERIESAQRIRAEVARDLDAARQQRPHVEAVADRQEDRIRRNHFAEALTRSIQGTVDTRPVHRRRSDE